MSVTRTIDYKGIPTMQAKKAFQVFESFFSNEKIELVIEIGKFFDYELIVENKPALIDDPVRRKPDISLASKKLNWKPFVQLEEGLKLLINSL